MEQSGQKQIKLPTAAFCVFPGAWFRFLDTPGMMKFHAAETAEDVWELHYCHMGNMRPDELHEPTDLASGDVWFVPRQRKHRAPAFPSGRYAGLSLLLSPQQAQQEVRTISSACLGTELDIERLTAEFRLHEGQIVHGANELRDVFSQVFLAKRPYREGFLRLKAMELLLYLNAGKPEPQEDPAWCQKERVREICRYLTEHLDQRMTQAEVAKRFHISLTALKLTFLTLYGMPMDAYLRRERMNTAKHLLRETDLPVSEIARRMGYGSHSQFSAAFRTLEGQSPQSYRRYTKS